MKKPILDNEPIIIDYYEDIADAEAFCSALAKRFRQSGHTRELVFRRWSCYDEQPRADGCNTCCLQI